MNGLKEFERSIKNKQLRKIAEEGTSSGNLTKLITESAYSEIGNKFPKLVPYVSGITIDKNNGNKGISLGGIIFFIEKDKYISPVIYNGKNVETGVLIYDPKNDTMLGMTKKLSGLILNSISSLSGTPTKEKVNFDIGNIKKLFVPPKTFSPKVASSSIFYTALENPLVKEALDKTISSNPEIKNILESYYGKKAINTNNLQKVARTVERMNIDISDPEVISTVDELSKKEWIFKEAAYSEIANYGVAISVGKDRQDKQLFPISSPDSIVKGLLGTDVLETISHDGAYNIIDKVDFLKKKVILHNGTIIGENGTDYNSKLTIGTECKIDEIDYLKYANRDTLSPGNSIILLKNGKLFGLTKMVTTPQYNMSSVEFTTLSKKDGYNKIIIMFDSDQEPRVAMGKLYIGSKNVMVIQKDISKSYSLNPITMRDLDSDVFSKNYYESSNLIKVKKTDNERFIMNGKLYTITDLASKLMNDGYDKLSVLTLLKTSEDGNQKDFIAMKKQMVDLTQIVTNLTGAVKNIMDNLSGIKSQQAQQAQQDQQDQQDQQVQQDQQAQQNQQQPQSMQQAQQQQASQQMQQASQQQPTLGGFTDNAQGFSQEGQQPTPEQQQEQQELLQQQQAQQQQAETEKFQKDLLQNGINPKMSPDVLNTIMSLKDSKIMDVSTLTMISQGTSMAAVFKELIPEFQGGVSALGRILFNIMSRENEVINVIGEQEYKREILNLKTMLFKSTDLLIDIMHLNTDSKA